MNTDQRRRGLRGNLDLDLIVGLVIYLIRYINSSFKSTKVGITKRVANKSSKLLTSTTEILITTIVIIITILRYL